MNVKFINPKKLQPRPDNRNKHPKEQIERLTQVIEAQGFRRPIIVSNQSGFVVAGHGRLEAALKLELEKVPVIYQDYATPELEYADHVADNALQTWSELDFKGINLDLTNLGPDLDIDLLGIRGFMLDPSEKHEVDDLSKEWTGMPEFTQNDKTAFRSLVIHMKDQSAVRDLENALGIKLTDKTRMLWYPDIEIETIADKAYVNEP